MLRLTAESGKNEKNYLTKNDHNKTSGPGDQTIELAKDTTTKALKVPSANCLHFRTGKYGVDDYREEFSKWKRTSYVRLVLYLPKGFDSIPL